MAWQYKISWAIHSILQVLIIGHNKFPREIKYILLQSNAQNLLSMTIEQLPRTHRRTQRSAPRMCFTLNICFTFCLGKLTLSLCRSCRTSLMLRLPSPFLSASVNVCFSHVRHAVKEMNITNKMYMLLYTTNTQLLNHSVC